jgi:short-subunit dehydrogenase
MPDDKPVKRYFTVVFEITNEENFTGMFAGPFTKSLAEESDIIEGVKVVCCGPGDTMTAYDALAQKVEDDGRCADDVVREYCEEMEIDATAVIG